MRQAGRVPTLPRPLNPPASVVSGLPERVRSRFRARVSGDPSGAPDWVREIASVGTGAGWYEPGGVVWRVHGDLSTLAGGVAALLGQGAHPLALAGVQRHSAYQQDPWQRLAGTARWLVVSTFGSTELAAREAGRVRALHARVSGCDDRGRAYAASDPTLLRWVHLAFTDAFLTAHEHLGADLAPRFGPRWPDVYVGQWQRSATELGASDLPATRAELAEALAELGPELESVPTDLRTFLKAPPGLNAPEQLFYAGLSRTASLLLSPTIAPLAGVRGRADLGSYERLQLVAAKVQLRGLRLVLGSYSPAEQAARFRLGTGDPPPWLS